MGSRCVGNPTRGRGVVMVITLLAIFLIAALLFYVMNVGRSVQGRVVTQHAADATAIAGASQVARSFNTVAMNNVETTRLIIAVSVLDGVPLAVDLAVTDETEEELGDIDAVAQAVSAQLRAGVIDDWFERKLRDMVSSGNPDSVLDERDELRELDELFRSQPDLVPEMTWYKAPSGQMGKMHQAMRSMDAQSRAVMQTLGDVAQAAASRSAPTNLGGERPGAAMLLPAAPTIPWQRGVFDDFERPVRFGLLPGQDRRLNIDSTGRGLGQVDGERYNRGPWDALFGLRTTNRIAASTGSTSIPGSFGSPPLPRSSGPSQGVPPTEYYVISPETALLRTLPNSYYARLDYHLVNLYSTKSNYLWSNSLTRTITDSAWEIDIDYDNERSDDRNSDHVYGLTDIQETAFVIVEMKSRTPNNPGNAVTQGVNWNYVTGRRSPRVIRTGGWFDPNEGPLFRVNPRNVKSGPTWEKVQDHIWKLSAVYETNPNDATLGGDPSIGLQPKRVGTDSDGNPVYAAQDVYWEIDVMLVGVNVGEQIDVSNPWEGFDRSAEDAPAPIDMAHQWVAHDDAEARWDYLTFLGVARQSNRSGMWPSRFDGDRPYPYNSAIAQAYVFNNHSWDLWTQSWQAQLEPVSVDRFNEWLARADAAVLVAEGMDELDPVEVAEMAEHLRATGALAPVMLNH